MTKYSEVVVSNVINFYCIEKKKKKLWISIFTVLGLVTPVALAHITAHLAHH